MPIGVAGRELSAFKLAAKSGGVLVALSAGRFHPSGMVTVSRSPALQRIARERGTDNRAARKPAAGRRRDRLGAGLRAGRHAQRRARLSRVQKRGSPLRQTTSTFDVTTVVPGTTSGAVTLVVTTPVPAWTPRAVNFSTTL